MMDILEMVFRNFKGIFFIFLFIVALIRACNGQPTYFGRSGALYQQQQRQCAAFVNHPNPPAHCR